MSMDLAKKTYSTTPDYFIAGTTVGIVTAPRGQTEPWPRTTLCCWTVAR